jgi:transposase
MAGSLPFDLRRRVLAAVADGLSLRAAAARFAVSASSISRWRALEREQGDARPKAIGGDQKSHRVDAHEDAIFTALGPERGRTIDEVRVVLRDEKGLAFGFGAIQRFFRRHAVTRKKDRARRRAKPPGHPEATRGLVRWPTRPRSRAPRLHR